MSGDGDTPFLSEDMRLDEEPSGRFVPGARLVVTPALRTSGLITALTDADFKSLMLLLTFLTPNGHIHPTLPQIADAMHESEKAARSRMQRLITFVWRDGPIVREVQRQFGLDCYVPAPHVVANQPAEIAKPMAAPPRPTAGREAIYAMSRKRYAKTRAEVERDVLEQLGKTPEEADDTLQWQARKSLENHGVSRFDADRLLTSFSLDSIERQIEWLPLRKAKNPARLLVAAIENDYDPPGTLRRGRQPISPGTQDTQPSFGEPADG